MTDKTTTYELEYKIGDVPGRRTAFTFDIPNGEKPITMKVQQREHKTTEAIATFLTEHGIDVAWQPRQRVNYYYGSNVDPAFEAAIKNAVPGAKMGSYGIKLTASTEEDLVEQRIALESVLARLDVSYTAGKTTVSYASDLVEFKADEVR